MRVRVKAGKKGFYGIKLHRGADEDRPVSDEFDLVERVHSTKKGDDGKPLVITVEQQFSEEWMEKVEPKAPEVSEGEPERPRRGRPPKAS